MPGVKIKDLDAAVEVNGLLEFANTDGTTTTRISLQQVFDFIKEGILSGSPPEIDTIEELTDIVVNGVVNKRSFHFRSDLVSQIVENDYFEVGDIVTANGLKYLYDGVSSSISDLPGFVPLGTTLYPEQFGADPSGGLDSSSAFQQLSDYIRSGDSVDGNSGVYLLNTPVTWDTNNIKFEGSSIVNFTTLSLTGGAFSFSGMSIKGPRFSGSWHFSGPEDNTSWEALDAAGRAELHSAVYLVGCNRPELKNISGDGIRIVIHANGCSEAVVKRFRVDGFLPDLADFTATGMSGPRTSGVASDPNWCEGLRFIACHDAVYHDLSGSNHGNVLTIGSTSLRPRITKVNVEHMHDNGVYISSAGDPYVSGVNGRYINGSTVKSRAWGSRVYHVTAFQAVTGVTLTATGTTDPSEYDVNTKREHGGCLVEGVHADQCLIGVLVDDITISGSGYSLGDVNVRGVEVEDHRGVGNMIPIRAYIAGGYFSLRDFAVRGGTHPNYAVSVQSFVSNEQYMPSGVSIRDGVVEGAFKLLLVDQVRNLDVRNINYSGVSEAIAILLSNIYDGSVTLCRGDDSSKRIDGRTNCNRLSIKDNQMFVYDDDGVEAIGNATDPLVNISTRIPFKAGQVCKTTTSSVAISKAATAASDWVVM